MKTKTFTELALDKKREAYYERRNKPGAPLAPMFERQAAELLTLDRAPDLGPGGEVVRLRLHGPVEATPDTVQAQDSRQSRHSRHSRYWAANVWNVWRLWSVWKGRPPG